MHGQQIGVHGEMGRCGMHGEREGTQHGMHRAKTLAGHAQSKGEGTTEQQMWRNVLKIRVISIKRCFLSWSLVAVDACRWL